MMAMAKAKDDDARFNFWAIDHGMAKMTSRKGCGCLMELPLRDFLLRDRAAFFCGGVDFRISGMRRLTLVCDDFLSRAGASYQGHDLEACETARAAARWLEVEIDDQRRVPQDACGTRRGCAARLYGLRPAARTLRCGRGAARLSFRSTRQSLRATCASGRSAGPAHPEDCEAHRARAPARGWPGACAWSLLCFGASTIDRASNRSPLALPRPGSARWNGLNAEPAPLDLLACLLAARLALPVTARTLLDCMRCAAAQPVPLPCCALRRAA